LEKIVDVSNLDDEIGECSDDSQHLCPIDQRFRGSLRLQAGE